MPRHRTLVSLLASLAFTSICMAQAPAASSPQFVTISFNAAVLQSSRAQADLKELQAKFAPRQTHLQTLSGEIEALKQQLNTNSATSTDREAKLRTLDTDQRQLQRDSDDYKADTDAALQQVFQSTAKKLYDFLQTYARQHGYTLIIDRGTDTAPVVWYAAANLDITDELVKDFDKSPAGTALPADHSTSHLPSAPPPH